MNNLLGEHIHSEIPTKVSEVKFSNFRVFKGETIFDFKREDGEISDFVCIYGKNGMGKSSFFDGVEWLFSGTIYRLQKEMKNDLKLFKGNILKNKYTNQNEFSVTMKLSNENLLKRSYKKNQSAFNDYKKGTFIGDTNYINNYDMLVLPHSKIDSFVYATNPQDKYNQWGEFWDPNEIERQKFNNIFKTKKECENILKDLEKEKNSTKDSLKKIKLKETDIKDINRVIEKYNKLNKSDELKKVVYKDNKLSTINLSNISKLKQNDLKEKDSKSIEVSKCNYLIKNHDKFILNNNEIERLKKEILKIEKENKDYKNKINLNKQKDDLQKHFLNIENRVEKLKNIKFKGEDWFSKTLIYKEISKSKNDLEKSLDIESKLLIRIDKKIQNLVDEKKRLEKKRNNYKLSIEEIENKLKPIYEDLIKIKKQLKLVEDKVKIINVKIKEIEQKISLLSKKYFDLEIKHTRLSSKWKTGNFESILEKDLYEEYSKKITDIESKIYQVEQDYKLNKNLHSDIKSNNELLSDIRISLKKYIIENELKECPLCNTEFKNLGDLIKQIDLTEINKTEDNIIKILENDKKLLENYILFKVSIFEDINKEVELLINSNEKCVDNFKIEKEILDKHSIELKDKIKNYEDKIFNFNEQIKAIINENIEGINEFDKIINIIQKEINIVQNKINIKEENIVNVNKQYKSSSLIIDRLEKEINSIDDMYKNIIKGNLNLYEFIIQENINSFCDLDNKLKEDENRLSEIMKKINLLVSEIANINKDINIEENTVRLNSINLKINENDKFIFEYKQNLISLDLPNDIDTIKTRKLKYEVLLSEIDEKLDLLNKLLSNNILETYNTQVKSLDFKLNNINSKINFYQKGLTRIELLFNLLKAKIETNIMNKFNGMTIDSVYKRIEPHKVYTKLKYEVAFNDKDTPELYIKGEDEESNFTILPQLFYSSAQLNTVALSIFLGEAISNQSPQIKTLFIDDPIGHFDDINILGFVDLLRTIVSKYGWQVIISTHDEVLFNILRKKISSKFYKSKFIEFNSPGCIKVKE